MNEMLLEARDLVVEYPPSRRAVDSVSFTLRAGATLGIVGESGSGKSSLARALLQLEDHSGEVHLRGERLETLAPRELRRARRHMQAVFQDPMASLDPRMTVATSIEEPLRVHEGGLNAQARRTKVLAMLRRVGLDDDHAARYPHELSGGQCQRVAIARAAV